MSKQARDRRHDAKRRRDKPWRNLYKTSQWQAIRLHQLTEHPLCKRHLDRGVIKRAEVVHHVVRHNGDPKLFFRGPFESLCKECHDSAAQSEERRGYSTEIGADGWPVDARHPAYVGVSVEPEVDLEEFWPRFLRPSAVPLTIVCGPPAAGKSTYVQKRKGPADVVVDLDEIVRSMGYQPRTTDWAARKRGLQRRNQMLRSLADLPNDGRRAWFVTTAPIPETRRQWAERLKATEVVVMLTPLEICLRRVHEDPERSAVASTQVRIIRDWWEKYAPGIGETVIRDGFVLA